MRMPFFFFLFFLFFVFFLLKEGTFFLGEGEGWGILVFFPKKVLALRCVFIKKILLKFEYGRV